MMKSVALSPLLPPSPTPAPPRKSPLRGGRPYRPRADPKLLTPPPLSPSTSYRPCDSARTQRRISQRKKHLQVPTLSGSELRLAPANRRGDAELEIHRDNAHHQHIFAEDWTCPLQASPQPEPHRLSVSLAERTTSSRKGRVSSVPNLQSPLHLPAKYSRPASKYPCLASPHSRPINRQRTKRISSAPLPPAPCSQKFPPVYYPPRERLISPQTPSYESRRSASDQFAPYPAAPRPKLWKKAVKKVIGIEGVREYEDVIAETGSRASISETLSPVVLLASRLKIKRSNKFNLNDAIYGSIGKEVAVEEDERRELHKAALEQLQHDYFNQIVGQVRASCAEDAGPVKRPVAAVPERTSPIVVKTGLQRIVSDPHDRESRSTFVFDPEHILQGQGLASVTTVPNEIPPSSLEELNITDQFDWPDILPVAPLDIRRNSHKSNDNESNDVNESSNSNSSINSSSSSSSSSMASMGLLDFQALLARVSADSTATNAQNIERLGSEILSSGVGSNPRKKLAPGKRIGFLSRGLLGSTTGAIRKHRSKLVMLSGTRLNLAGQKARALATTVGNDGATADFNEMAGRISDNFLNFTQLSPLLSLLALPVKFVSFVMTLVLFPPRASPSSDPPEVRARKEALRGTVMDAMIMGEFICFVWVLYRTIAALHLAFLVMCYPVLTLFSFVLGM
ncbi:hypothetical protein V1509DRAFT_514692 [Lipomyces kononenkoae]